MTITGGGYLMSSRRKVHGTGRLVVPLNGSVVTYTGLSTFGATTVVDEWKLGPIPVNVMDSQFNAWPDCGNYIARVAPLGTITVSIVPAYIGIGQSATITVTSDTAAPTGGILVDLEYGSDLDSGRYTVPLSLTITAGNLSASGTIYTYDVEVTISVTPITMDYGDSALVTVSYVAGVAPAGGTYVGLETVDGVTPDCYYYLPGEVYIAPGQASGSVVLETFVSPRMYVTGLNSGSNVGAVGVLIQSNIGVSDVSSGATVSSVGFEYQYINILTQPVDTSVLQPDEATFSISAETNYGTGLSYQWKKNGVNVGTNSTTYNTGATTWTGVDDVITCVVSNGVASVNSNTATLNVRKITSAALPDCPYYITVGQGAYFSGGTVELLSNAANVPIYQGYPETGVYSLFSNAGSGYGQGSHAFAIRNDGTRYVNRDELANSINIVRYDGALWVVESVAKPQFFAGKTLINAPNIDRLFLILENFGVSKDIGCVIRGSSWGSYTSLVAGYGNANSVYCNGFIYIFGVSTGKTIQKVNPSTLAVTDTGTRQTTVGTNVPGLCAVGNKICIVTDGTVQFYDTDTNTLSDVTALNRNHGSGGVLAYYNNAVYCFGGLSQNQLVDRINL